MINSTFPIEQIEPQDLGVILSSSMEIGTDLGLLARALPEKTHDQPNLWHRSHVLESRKGLHLTFNSAQRMQAYRLGGFLRFIVAEDGTRAGGAAVRYGPWRLAKQGGSQSDHAVKI
jgi:hypothetical protein